MITDLDFRDAWLAEITTLMASAPQYPPGGTPAQPAPVTPPRVYRKFGGYLICTTCNMAREYCACDKQPPPPPPTGDGVDSSLEKRVRDLRGGRV